MMERYTVKLFNDKELDYLRLSYKGVDKEEIAKELEFKHKREHKDMEQLIWNKLSVNNWYNAYRKAFHLQLLSRKDFLFVNIRDEASTFSAKITNILFSVGLSDKEKELKVYLALLSFYTRVEYSYLLKGETH